MPDITEADFAYLRNINTSPGPNAGRSIDPTKPGPDDTAPSPGPQDVREALKAAISDAAEEIADLTDNRGSFESLRILIETHVLAALPALAQSDAMPDTREAIAAPPRPDASGLIEAAEIYRKALDRISKSNLMDMGTLHPDSCPRIAADALRAAGRSEK